MSQGEEDNVSRVIALFYWLSLVILNEEGSLSRNNLGKNVLQRLGTDQIDYHQLTYPQALKLANNALLIAVKDGMASKQRNKYFITEFGLRKLREGQESTVQEVEKRLS